MTLSMQFQASNFSHFMAYNLSKFFQLQILIGNIVVVFESIKIDLMVAVVPPNSYPWFPLAVTVAAVP